MTDTALDGILYALLLILPVAALTARRLPIGATFKMALAWLAIFGTAWIVVALWQDAFAAGTTLSTIFS